MRYISTNTDFEITLDNGERSIFIETLLQDVKYKNTWTSKYNNYIKYDYEPLTDANGWILSYICEKEDNKDNPWYEFVSYLCGETVNRVNDLNKLLDDKEIGA